MKNNWQNKKLGEVATITGGYAFKSIELEKDKKDESFLPVVKIGNLEVDGRLHFEETQFYKFDSKLQSFLIKNDDVLVAMTGATVGKVAISDKNNLLLNQRVGLVRPKQGTLQDYLKYLLLKRDFYNYCQKKAGGSAQGNISPTQILLYDVNVPSLPIQQQIVEKLDAIRKLQGLNEIEIKRTEELSDGLVNRVFSSKTGKKCKINEIAEGFQYGLSREMNTNGNGIPILRINSIEGGSITNVDSKHVIVSGEELNKYKVHLDDILFNRTNSYELVGKTGIFKLPGTFVFASYLIRLKAKDNVLPDYLNYFLNSPMGQAEIKRKAKRAVSQANVNAKELGSISMYVPEKSIQEKAISQLNSVKQYLQTLKVEKEKLVEFFERLLNKELQV